MNIQPLEFVVNSLTLRGNFYQADNPKHLAVLFLHGWTGLTNEPAAKMLAENGFSAMTFSLSGHNNSDGKIEDQTRQKSLQEILAAYDLLKSKLPPDTKIGVAGNSYGGYNAAVLSSQRPTAFIQMRVPANYPDEGFNEKHTKETSANPEMMKWRRLNRNNTASKSLRALNNFNGPVQIIEAELDDAIPHQVVECYISAVKNTNQLEYHLMKGWTHSLGPGPERNRQYQEILLNWLKTQV